uniref:Uncharacterized protein n=1 Tax=Mola mola TaxID=94237 RepID=A0A3Q4AFA4_MOLML
MEDKMDAQRGVAILIWKNFNIKILTQQSDEEGRWLAIDAELFGIRCTFMNIYAPPADLPGFFVEVSNEITQFGNFYVVLGGDFYHFRNPKVDKTYTWGITRPSQARKATDTMEEDILCAIFWMFGNLAALNEAKNSSSLKELNFSFKTVSHWRSISSNCRSCGAGFRVLCEGT